MYAGTLSGWQQGCKEGSTVSDEEDDDQVNPRDHEAYPLSALLLGDKLDNVKGEDKS